IGGGLEFYERARASVVFWKQPEPDDSPGAYRGSGYRSTVRYFGPGFFPYLGPHGNGHGRVESELELSLDGTNHQSRVRGTLRNPAHWGELDETRYAARFTEEFPHLTALGESDVYVSGETHHFDQNLDRLDRLLQLPLLRQHVAAGSLELVEGFVNKEWGFGLNQDVTKWVTLGGEWDRTEYALTQPRADRVVGTATIRLGHFLSVTGSSERVHRKGEDDLVYDSAALDLRF
ncbi:MAG: hypothetical protein JO102_07445, partial [Elusimicrobia bacterium]|nr:hypothetical protein [Elusimicrobiota bacterium]